jgi:hypothetical protein
VGEEVEGSAPASMVMAGKRMIRFVDMDLECSSVNIYESAFGNQHSTFSNQYSSSINICPATRIRR